jgi:metallo-beta-lactamase family protein
VTGSLHFLECNGETVVFDCGLFQGHRADAARKNREIPEKALSADAVLLSHAHIDHSGNLPTLVRRGYQGNIFCTPATRDLCSVMLRDSAMLQAQDARYLNKRRKSSQAPIEPLYDAEDAQRAVSQMIGVPWRRTMRLSKTLSFSFHDSAHVLGSSLVLVDAQDRGVQRRILFSGDLGRPELPLLRTPEHVDNVDTLVLESTYGDRLHPPFEGIDEELAEIIKSTVKRGGRIYIPTFALERAQEVLFALERLHEAEAIPKVPIYIDSPLAISVTEIYKLHPDCLSPEVRDRVLSRNDPFRPPGLHYISEVEDSIALQDRTDPCIVIAGSGMCEGGRIVHHLRRNLSNSKNTVVIVGFMAQHTLGRRLVEGHKNVRVLGMEREVRASIRKLEGLSAHADQRGLVEFAKAIAARGNVRRLVLVHGEQEPQETLAARLKEAGLSAEIICPQPGDTLEL